MKQLLCNNCEQTAFSIERELYCSECENNRAWDEDTQKWINDPKLIEEKELVRDHVEDAGECDIGTAYGEGCYVIYCLNCGQMVEHIPYAEG